MALRGVDTGVVSEVPNGTIRAGWCYDSKRTPHIEGQMRYRTIAVLLIAELMVLAGCNRMRVTSTPQATPTTRPYETETKVALPRYMTDMPQPMPEQIMIANAPKTARSVEVFRSLTRTMTMADVVRRCGVPDEHQGSGIYIFIYHLEDGSVVAVGTADLKKLFYVDHFDPSGKASHLLPRK
jgi:hypothetical protein